MADPATYQLFKLGTDTRYLVHVEESACVMEKIVSNGMAHSALLH